jgi:hypothetical protein
MYTVGSVTVNYDEDSKVLMITIGGTVVEFRNIDMEMFAELCAAFGYFRDHLRDNKAVIRYRTADIFGIPPC